MGLFSNGNGAGDQPVTLDFANPPMKEVISASTKGQQ